MINKDGTRTQTKIDTVATFKKWPEWNHYHIVAKGQHIILGINGVKSSELIDREEGHFDLKGILGLQLRAGKPMTVQFKEIYFKERGVGPTKDRASLNDK